MLGEIRELDAKRHEASIIRRRNTGGYFRTDALDAAYKNISWDRNVPFAPNSWWNSIAVSCFVAFHHFVGRARVCVRVIDFLIECVVHRSAKKEVSLAAVNRRFDDYDGIQKRGRERRV